MALHQLHPFQDEIITHFDSTAGTAAGKTGTAIVPSPYRGRILEIGLCPTGSCSSNMTLGLTVFAPTGSTAVFSSTALGPALGVTNIPAGCGVGIDVAIDVAEGDGLQWTASGGPTSATGATFYAIIRRG